MNKNQDFLIKLEKNSYVKYAKFMKKSLFKMQMRRMQILKNRENRVYIMQNAKARKLAENLHLPNPVQGGTTSP